MKITPEPSEDERRAILAALGADEGDVEPDSAWAQALLPARDDEP